MSTTTAEALDLAKTGGSHPGRFFTDVVGVDPIRAELFGLDHLQTHACELAQASPVVPAIRAGHPLLARFIQNGRRLVEAHRRITEATHRLESITPDAEWLLDNFHIVADALREIRIDLPSGYYRKLPKLAGGPLAGFPRVYTLALELIAHTDSTIDETNITRFVQSYQTVRPLSIGELWAVPIMLRLGLVENLRRLSDQMLKAWSHRGQAQACCEQLVANKERLGPEGPTAPLESVLPPRAHWSDPFVVWLLQGLRDSGPDASRLIEWLESHLIGTDYHPVEVLRREHQRQAANQVSVGNCVTSLRLLSALDWNVLFERMSLVEAVLQDDPAGAYARQDFATKDRYRRIVERLARGSNRDELSVARAALALSRRQQPRPQHVGEYLIGRGRRQLERDIGYRPRLRDRLLGGVLEHARLVYFGVLAATFALLLAGFLSLGNGGSWAVTLALVVLLLLPVTELSVGIIHHVLTMFIPPRVLPKLDLKDGISADWATFVVMPTMLIRPESAAGLADRLEVHYLSNPEPNLYFALLTDFADAPTETMPEDQEYLLAAQERIKALNERYCAGGPDRFFLFHRRRVWNPVQGCWMGWERKRGKLQEFNRLLRGARNTSFVTVKGAFVSSPRIRYVITLDADTQLPREAARRLIGTLAHPLNQARIDPDQGRVIEGYGVLQPRVSLSLVAATRSLFARILSSSAGIDPYTTAVSDVYQDLFGIGSFTGKGIYDIDAFEMSAGRAFPENHILSHDLIEGNYARCGLVTDIELLDDFPSRYHAYALREHRWIRGDWQLLPWLSPKVPVPNQERGSSEPVGRDIKQANPLPWVERWKVFDNLRRSLVPPSLVGLLVAGWALPGLSAWIWTAIALSVPGLPVLLVLINSIRGLPGSGSWELKLRDAADRLRSTCAQFLLNLIFLVEQARLALDAVARTLARLLITRRNFLEWETAAATERRLGNDLLNFCLTMWVPPVLALGLAVLLAVVHPEALLPASAVLIAWLLSPAVAFWVSRPRRPAADHLTPEEHGELRRFARKTWSFFERFVGSEDHWLPPDNYQEDPKSAVAHRTSPTNIGLCLISNLAAHDLGYLSLSALGDRLEKTFDTLERLERMHGHFYNWYDTITLRPLQPGYISTVDSGNLLACLLTLKEGLREKAETAVVGVPQRQGLADTLNLVNEELRDIDPLTVPEQLEVFQSLNAAVDELARRLDVEAPDLYGWHMCLLRLDEPALKLVKGVQQLAGMLHEKPEDLERWATRFAEQARQHLEELQGLAPWLGMIAELDAENNEPGAKNPGASPNAAWREQWQTLRTRLLRPESIGDLQTEIQAALAELAERQKKGAGPKAPGSDPNSDHDPSACLARLAAALQSSTAGELIARCHRFADRAHQLAADMDFKLLYNEQRHLFSIGFNLAHNRLDNAHYDLLASEACLASFLAIARGDAPKRHWFHLGRPLTRAAGKIVLLSWGGTMFEYLMPRLFLRTYDGTLLDESCRSAVDLQIDYGRQHRVPWGISESAFSALDATLNYQYQAFGVPGLGLKRGLADNLVIAPYAAALALAVRPRAALENLRALRREGGEGPFGFYEALDYTRDRRVEKRRPALVRSYMAHHQGMSLIALANCLCGNPMVRRCHAEAMVRATELLLQERMPRNAPLVNPPHEEAPSTPAVRERPYPMSRVVSTPHTAHPRTHLLSNGSYHVMVTNAGGGYATWRDLDVTRWREDRTRDCWGQFVYLRNLRQGLVWSAGYQPLGRSADRYEVVFSNDKAEFRRTDAGIETHLEIIVSPDNPAEVRRLTITNHNPRVQELDVTSYAEIVLGAHAGDLAHPAFAKLFLETEYLPADSALLCRRRPRAAEQKPIWAVHVLAVDAPTVGDVQFETDRCRFLGRGRTPANPQALEPNAALSGTTGAVLDPIFSLRQRLRIEPGASVNVAFTTGVAETREDALALADQYHDFHGVNRAFELAWAHSQVQLQHLRLSPGETHLYQRLAAHILYPGSALRSHSALTANHQGQPALWRHGISGDHPIVLVRIAEPEELALVRQLLLAHAYWRVKGLVVDLVILNDHPASYLEELHEQIQNLVRVSESHTLIDKPGGVFVRRSVQLSEDDKILLQAAAVVVLLASRGALEAQIERSERSVALPARLAPTERKKEVSGKTLVDEAKASPSKLSFTNGLGGFSADGREYWILPYGGRGQPSTPSRTSFAPPGTLRSNAAKRDRVETQTMTLPPAPWINVIANPSFGFLVSETGGGYTWSGNSQSNRLTPWHNDPVADPPSEVLYLRDERSGEFWTPTPFLLGTDKGETAARPMTTGRVRHGQGYTVFERTSNGLSQQLLLFVPVNDPIKIYRLKVRNLGSETRQLSATFFCEWVLGTVRDQAGRHLIPQFDSESDALLARNAFNIDFGNRLAFAAVNRRPRTFTADRTEFLGRNGSVAAPAALSRVTLSGRAEPATDACAAFMAPFDLRPGEEREIVFFLGQAADVDEVRRLLRRYRDPGQVQTAFDEVCKHWDRILSAVQVRTPDPAIDLLLNRWLLYQVLSCRVWARSAFYQSGGAYGFRDQLQDVMALVYGAAEAAREQILRAAARQFLEGDVQHWWHPPSGRGVRTRFSDDFLWLPFVACHYVDKTGDLAILDERLPFLRAPVLKPEQEEDYGLPEVTTESATLYDHCVRAIENGMHLGAHGLPLMGTGDWNDGMNRVGAGGKGESVWDGWFLLTILRQFADLAEVRHDSERASRYREQAERLRTAIEEHGWDGRWYRRAFFDDGTPLGSQQNDECTIDSLTQTWAVIADAARPERARQAMAAVAEMLVRPADKLILLFTPPFDKGRLHPGYIKGYVPGIRENGGQYTHAATWVVQATALLGQGSKAVEFFNLLNPIHHAGSPEDIARYRVEPYVVAADVYSQPPHTGRGGWTWYTGSAGWLYRVGLENILGFQLKGNKLRIQPAIPSTWSGYEITYRHRSAVYRIKVENADQVEQGVKSVTVDGQAQADGCIDLVDDGKSHEVRVVLGAHPGVTSEPDRSASEKNS